MNNSKFYFVALHKPYFFLLALSVILFICVLASCSRPHRISTTEVRQEGTRQTTLLDFLCPLSEEDDETMKDLHIIIYRANFRIDVAKKEGVESFDHIVNDDIREAMNLSKKIISSVDSRIVLPDIFWAYLHPYHPFQNGNTCEECVLKHFESMSKMARLSYAQLSTMIQILHNSFEIHESQAAVDLMLQSLLLLESLGNSIQLSSYYSCVQGFFCYYSLVIMYRPLEIYPRESQMALTEMIERVKLKLNLMVYGLVYNARNETLLAVPLFLQSGHQEHVEEAMELVAYYDDIIENMPAFFDLGKGAIYNLNLDEIDYGDGSLMSHIRFMKAQVQFMRDRFSALYQHTCLLLPDDPIEE